MDGITYHIMDLVNMIRVDLALSDENENPILFILYPDIISGYNSCALSKTGNKNVIYLEMKYNKWIINIDDRVVEHHIDHHIKGIIKQKYKFIKFTIN